MQQLHIECRAYGIVQVSRKIKVLARGAGRHRSVEEPGRTEIHATEELPISLQLGPQDIEERLPGELREQPVQADRTENQQYHRPIMVGAGLSDADSFTHERTTPVAADCVIGVQHASAPVAGLDDLHVHAGLILHHRFDCPPEECLDVRDLTQAVPQYRFRGVLWQAFIVGKIEGTNELALQPVVPIGTQKRPVGRHPSNAVFDRNRSRRTQWLFGCPEMEVLHRALGQVLPFWNRLWRAVFLDQDTADAALAKLDGQPQSHRPASDDEYFRRGSACLHGRLMREKPALDQNRALPALRRAVAVRLATIALTCAPHVIIISTCQR